MPWTRDPTIETEDQPVQLSAEVGDYTLYAWELADGSGAWLISAGDDGPDREQTGKAASLRAAQRAGLRALRHHLVTALFRVGWLERSLDAAEAAEGSGLVTVGEATAPDDRVAQGGGKASGR